MVSLKRQNPAHQRPAMSGRLLWLSVSLASMLVASGCSIAAPAVVVEALFEVSAEQPVLVGDGCPRFDARENELFQKTQIALVKSQFVLQAAVRDPAIAALPLLAAEADPVKWLTDNLAVGFVDGSEILSIRLRGSQSDAEDLRQLVDAVVKAYLNEVVYRARQRGLTARDAKAKGIDRLRDELEGKIARLEERQAESGESSTALKLDQAEVDVLLDLWRSLVRSLEVDDLNMGGAPDRVRQLQPAMVSPD